MSNTPSERPELRALIGTTFTFPMPKNVDDLDEDDGTGQLIIAPGMEAVIEEVFDTWYGRSVVILYARCKDTGLATHFSLEEAGVEVWTKWCVTRAPNGATVTTYKSSDGCTRVEVAPR